MGALRPHQLAKQDLGQVKSIYDTVEGRDERYELNLYITGYDEDETGDGRRGHAVRRDRPAGQSPRSHRADA